MGYGHKRRRLTLDTSERSEPDDDEEEEAEGRGELTFSPAEAEYDANPLNTDSDGEEGGLNAHLYGSASGTAYDDGEAMEDNGPEEEMDQFEQQQQQQQQQQQREQKDMDGSDADDEDYSPGRQLPQITTTATPDHVMRDNENKDWNSEDSGGDTKSFDDSDMDDSETSNGSRKRKQRSRPDWKEREAAIEADKVQMAKPRRAPPVYTDSEMQDALLALQASGPRRSQRVPRAAAAKERKEKAAKPPKPPKPPKPDPSMLPGKPLTQEQWTKLDSEEDESVCPGYCFLCEFTKSTDNLDSGKHYEAIIKQYIEGVDKVDPITNLTQVQAYYETHVRWCLQPASFQLPWYRRVIHAHFTEHTRVQSVDYFQQICEMTTMQHKLRDQVTVFDPRVMREVVDIKKIKAYTDLSKVKGSLWKEYNSIKPTATM